MKRYVVKFLYDEQIFGETFCGELFFGETIILFDEKAFGEIAS
jgi:hypothetical protein